MGDRDADTDNTDLSRLTPAAAGAVRAAIRLAGGREVCFVCTLDAEGAVATARVVARGDAASVLALPGFAKTGELLLHNHPSGDPTPSPDDVAVTRAIVQAGKLLDVETLDHLVIGHGARWVSMKERALGFS